MRTKQEIEKQLKSADDNPNVCSGMSYVDGVKYALEWVLKQSEALPIEEE